MFMKRVEIISVKRTVKIIFNEIANHFCRPLTAFAFFCNDTAWQTKIFVSDTDDTFRWSLAFCSVSFSSSSNPEIWFFDDTQHKTSTCNGTRWRCIQGKVALSWTLLLSFEWFRSKFSSVLKRELPWREWESRVGYVKTRTSHDIIIIVVYSFYCKFDLSF